MLQPQNPAALAILQDVSLDHAPEKRRVAPSPHDRSLGRAGGHPERVPAAQQVVLDDPRAEMIANQAQTVRPAAASQVDPILLEDLADEPGRNGHNLRVSREWRINEVCSGINRLNNP